MVRKRRKTLSYGVRPYELRGTLPQSRTIVVGGTYGEGKRKGREVNPAAIHQALRKVSKRPTFIGAQVGMWEGKPEKSYAYRATAGKKAIERVRKETGQEAIYTEDPRGFYLHQEEGQTEITHYKYVITVRKKADMDARAVMNQINSIVGDGSFFETQSTIRFETALFFGSERNIMAKNVQALIRELRRQGIHASTSVKTARSDRPRG